jgi:hypothetical protein
MSRRSGHEEDESFNICHNDILYFHDRRSLLYFSN